MDINYELYKVFYFVANALSFSEASKQLFISQSAVSQSIKSLEKRLGQTLFIRSTKKVQLTPEGEILLRHVSPAINLIERGESQLLESRTTGGQIRIGVSDTICRHYLLPYLETYRKEYPNAHIKITNQTSTACVELLASGQVDVIITNFPNTALNNIYNIKVIKDFRDIFMANKLYTELQEENITLETLHKYPILMLDQKSTTSAFLHDLFQSRQLDLVSEIELGSNDVLLDMARIGLGVACIPDYCVPPKSKRLFQLNMQDPLPMRQLVLVHNDSIPVSKPVENFLKMFE